MAATKRRINRWQPHGKQQHSITGLQEEETGDRRCRWDSYLPWWERRPKGPAAPAAIGDHVGDGEGRMDGLVGCRNKGEGGVFFGPVSVSPWSWPVCPFGLPNAWSGNWDWLIITGCQHCLKKKKIWMPTHVLVCLKKHNFWWIFFLKKRKWT